MPTEKSPRMTQRIKAPELVVALRECGIDRSEETIRSWARSGMIPGTKIGRDWFFDLAAVTLSLSEGANPKEKEMGVAI